MRRGCTVFLFILILVSIAMAQQEEYVLSTLYPFQDGINGEYGYMDTNFEVKIQPQFVIANEFFEGFAVAGINRNALIEYVFIDNKGKIYQLPFPVFYLGDFHEGRAVFTDARGSGYFDHNFKAVIPPKYSQARDFSNSFASVAQIDINEPNSFFIDRQGWNVFNKYFFTCNAFSEGYASVRNRQGKEGFIDTNGDVVIPYIFEQTATFSEDFCGVKIDTDKWGFINKQGKIVIEANYIEVGNYHNGHAVVRTNDGFGVIDTTGKFIIPPIYTRLESISAGLLAFIRNSGEDWGVMDLTENILVDPQFSRVFPYKNGLARVVFVRNIPGEFTQEEMAYINQKGEIIWGKDVIEEK